MNIKSQKRLKMASFSLIGILNYALLSDGAENTINSYFNQVIDSKKEIVVDSVCVPPKSNLELMLDRTLENYSSFKSERELASVIDSIIIERNDNKNTYFAYTDLVLGKAYVKENVLANRLIALNKSGDEIFQDRFYSGETKAKSLKEFANNLGINPGDYNSNPELRQKFIDIYKEDIIKTANKYALNPNLLMALAISESGGRTFTISPTGALGPFGLTFYAYNSQRPWSDEKVREPINPFNTLEAMDRAADYISLMINIFKKYDDANHTLALAAYNQGQGVVFDALAEARKNKVYGARKTLDFMVIPQLNDSIFLDTPTHVKDSLLLAQAKYVVPSEGRKYPQHIKNNLRSIDILN